MVRLLFCSACLALLSSSNVRAYDPEELSSGLRIGVKVLPVGQGLQVSSVIPNTPAHGFLLPNDILRFLTADGHPVYSAQRISHIEKAKSVIGMNTRAFLEISRNGHRLYLQIMFAPTNNGLAQMQMENVPQAVSATIGTLFDGQVGGPSAGSLPLQQDRSATPDPFK